MNRVPTLVQKAVRRTASMASHLACAVQRVVGVGVAPPNRGEQHTHHRGGLRYGGVMDYQTSKGSKMDRILFEQAVLQLCESAEEITSDRQVADALASAVATYIITRDLSPTVFRKTFRDYHRIMGDAPIA